MANRIDLEDKISDRLAQLASLLTGCYGVGAQWIEEIGPGHRDNILWLASDLCNEVQTMAEQLPSATVPTMAADPVPACAPTAPWVTYARHDVRRIADLLLTALEGCRHSGSAMVAHIEAAANVLHFMQKAPTTDLLWSNEGDPAHVLDLLEIALGSLLQAQAVAQSAAGVPSEDDLPTAVLSRVVHLLRDFIRAMQRESGVQVQGDAA